MKQFILGTAGHIDHGKTSLIKAVTGIDTDRLKEEKERGITIELGFASIDLPGGFHVGVVDVPGHEKFVKNMVAGATGIDIVAMVIAADEGVMPQTREHLEICSLLGIKHGMIVLTKTDIADPDWLELVREDVMDFVDGTFLEDAPVVEVSSATGEGIPEFIAVLDEICTNLPDMADSGVFRLPIDRVFTMKGFGTVITGTLVSGKVKVGDQVMIYPGEIVSKVRGLQVHNESVEEATAGLRTAINFSGLEKAAIERGGVVSHPGILKSNYMTDVSLQYLSSCERPLKNRARVRFHTGTSEIPGVVVPLETEEMLPGDVGFAQIRLEAPVTLVKGDRFVVRSYSPVRTIGGGTILNPVPVKHKKFKKNVLEGLNMLAGGDPAEAIRFHAFDCGGKGIGFSDLMVLTNLSEKGVKKKLDELLSKRSLITADKEARIYVDSQIFENLKNNITESLKSYHASKPLKTGMPKEELKSKLPGQITQKLYTLLLASLAKDEKIKQDRQDVSLANHKVALAMDQEKARTAILSAYIKGGLAPPNFKDIAASFKADEKQAEEVLTLLIDEGSVIKVKEGLYFHADHIEDIKTRLVEYLSQNLEITTPKFKELTASSRKYVIPLIEYFDAIKVTLRIGDVRKLRKG